MCVCVRFFHRSNDDSLVDENLPCGNRLLMIFPFGQHPRGGFHIAMFDYRCIRRMHRETQDMLGNDGRPAEIKHEFQFSSSVQTIHVLLTVLLYIIYHI